MKVITLFIGVLALILGGCQMEQTNQITTQSTTDMKSLEKTDYAIFGGGCFWCVESAFQATDGVVEAVNGYTGGSESDATYEKVSSGQTNHVEVSKVYYHPELISYEELLQIYFRNIDPTDVGGQFTDRGPHYESVIYYKTEEQKKQIEDYIDSIKSKYDKPIVVRVEPEQTFYEAEEYHQDYFLKKTGQYEAYAKGSGRKDYVAQESPLIDEEYNVQNLTDLQYYVTQKGGTEKAFDNEYWNETRDGIYVDVVDGTPLFSSEDKFDSGTGWPSFTKPINDDAITKSLDFKLVLPRTEIKSASADSHLGHVFNDGPKEDGGKRFCLNSAALRFIPVEELEQEGYGEYKSLFE